MLVKLYISSKSPSSPIGAVLDPESLKLGFFLDRLVEVLVEAIGVEECRAPYTFFGMVVRFQTWFRGQEGSEVFVKPVPSRADDCWLPPVRDVDLARGRTAGNGNAIFSNAVSDEPLQSNLRNMDLNPVSVESQSLTDGQFGFEMEEEQGIDDFLLYDGMEGFQPGLEPGFENWIPDLEIPSAGEGYEWGFQRAGNMPG